MIINPFIFGSAVETEFKITVITTKAGSAPDTFVLPLQVGATSMTVYWGDGNSDVITAYNQAELTHVYASSGTYQISLDGSFYGIRFANGGDCLKLASIDNWGTNQWGTMNFAFGGCTNMIGTYTDSPDLSLTLNLGWIFYRCSSFNSDVSWNTSNVTSMYGMFNYCSLFNQSVSSFDTSNVVDMTVMFFGAYAFNQSVSNFNTSNVGGMASMFRASSFNQPISNFDTSNVVSMGYMFFQNSSFNQDISSWDITSLTSASIMLYGTAFSKTNYDLLLPAWDAYGTSGITFHAGNAHYSAGAPTIAHDAMVSRGWTITDGGTP